MPVTFSILVHTIRLKYFRWDKFEKSFHFADGKDSIRFVFELKKFFDFKDNGLKIWRPNCLLISVDKRRWFSPIPASFYSRTGASTSPYLSVLAGNVRKKSFRFWRYNRFYLLFSFHPPRWCTATPDPRQLFTFYLSMYPRIYICIED